MTDKEACNDLEGNVEVKSTDNILEHVMEKSKRFPIKFPVDTVRCSSLVHNSVGMPTLLEKFIKSTYPVIHESVLPLYHNFLEYKKTHGSVEEKVLYANMGVVELVDRLLKKRAVAFVGPYDTYLLLDGRLDRGGWNNIGKDGSGSVLSLTDCLSYDEMKLSALMSVSSYSCFINDGNRHNKGKPAENMESVQKTGVVIGLIGARFARLEKMEWEDIMVTQQQNIGQKGYGPQEIAKLPEHNWRQLWCDFYNLGPHHPLYTEVDGDLYKSQVNRYVKLRNDYFDNTAFANRLAVSFETLLLEGQHRAQATDKYAYIHVVGIGLGVWKISKHQEKIFLDTFANCLTRLLPFLHNVSDINFAWFNERICGGVSDGGFFRSSEHSRGIQIHFSKRSPHDRLDDPNENKLLVVSYAWDSNALPGNEFWFESLVSSGDPAQACSSQVAELHNPHINDGYVCGSNLHIASKEWGVIPVAQYELKS